LIQENFTVYFQSPLRTETADVLVWVTRLLVWCDMCSEN